MKLLNVVYESVMDMHEKKVADMSRDEFIKNAKSVHGKKFKYDRVKMGENVYDKVIITCPKHGDFSQSAYLHLQGKGCKHCFDDSRRMTRNDFIQKAKVIHQNKYKYNNVDMGQNSHDKVMITCPKHGDFSQSPTDHLRGKGCDKCLNDSLRTSPEEFIKKSRLVHGNKYSYDKVNYINNKIPVTITCAIHGDFEKAPNKHIVGRGCEKCSLENRKIPRDEFIKRASKIHDGYYTYDNLVMGRTLKDKVLITCPIHGNFSQKPGSHLEGQGCPNCSESKGEKTIKTYLKENNINYKIEERFKECFSIGNKTKKCTYLPFDFYLPDIKTLIEVDGLQHFKPLDIYGEGTFERIVRNDILKNNFVKKNGSISKLIRLYYDGRNFKYLISELDSLLNTKSPKKIVLSKDYPKAGWNK
jgi:hypothetical protein